MCVKQENIKPSVNTFYFSLKILLLRDRRGENNSFSVNNGFINKKNNKKESFLKGFLIKKNFSFSYIYLFFSNIIFFSSPNALF